jgi:hypothetical protein
MNERLEVFEVYLNADWRSHETRDELFAGDPPLVCQAVERGIQRTLLNFQAVFRNLLNAQQNAVAVQWI